MMAVTTLGTTRQPFHVPYETPGAPPLTFPETTISEDKNE